MLVPSLSVCTLGEVAGGPQGSAAKLEPKGQSRPHPPCLRLLVLYNAGQFVCQITMAHSPGQKRSRRLYIAPNVPRNFDGNQTLPSNHRRNYFIRHHPCIDSSRAMRVEQSLSRAPKGKCSILNTCVFKIELTLNICPIKILRKQRILRAGDACMGGTSIRGESWAAFRIFRQRYFRYFRPRTHALHTSPYPSFFSNDRVEQF